MRSDRPLLIVTQIEEEKRVSKEMLAKKNKNSDKNASNKREGGLIPVKEATRNGR
jgi:hypothetical protein